MVEHSTFATSEGNNLASFVGGNVYRAYLLKLNGKYAEMWRVQAQNYLAEEAAI